VGDEDEQRDGDEGDREREDHDCAPFTVSDDGQVLQVDWVSSSSSRTDAPARASASAKSGHVPKLWLSQWLAVVSRSLGMSFRTALARQ
jgi:hypothetical protein